MLYFFWELTGLMDYKKRSLKKLKCFESYEEIDTRLATGWYVDSIGGNKKKKYKTKEVTYKISKKNTWSKISHQKTFRFVNCIKNNMYR